MYIDVLLDKVVDIVLSSIFWGVSEARVGNPGPSLAAKGGGWDVTAQLVPGLHRQTRPLAEKSQANARDRDKPSILGYAQGSHLSATNIEHSCLRSFLK